MIHLTYIRGDSPVPPAARALRGTTRGRLAACGLQRLPDKQFRVRTHPSHHSAHTCAQAVDVARTHTVRMHSAMYM